jgi:hypothetical protein
MTLEIEQFFAEFEILLGFLSTRAIRAGIHVCKLG